MHKIIGPVLFIFFLVEVGAAAFIVSLQPDGINSLVSFNIGPERIQELIPQVYDTDPNTGTITVENDNGKIELIGDATVKQVTIKATKIVHESSDSAFNNLNFETQIVGNDVTVKANIVSAPMGINFGNDRVDISITCPPKILVNINNSNGAASITGLDNPDSKLKLKTDNGSITITQSTTGQMDLSSNNGSISLNGVAGILSAEAKNGKIEALNSTLGLENVKSDNGQIKIDGKLAQTANGNIETKNGSITLNLDNASTARYNISTGNGSINFKVPGIAFEKQEKNNVITKGNGPVIQLKSNNGSITISQ